MVGLLSVGNCIAAASVNVPTISFITKAIFQLPLSRQKIIHITEDEIDTLNRLVVIFLETAELRAKRQTITTMAFWQEHVGQIITSNGFPLLSGAGKKTHAYMESKVGELFADYDERRKLQEAQAADLQDESELNALEKRIKSRTGK